MSSVLTNFNNTNPIAEDHTITCFDDIPKGNADPILFRAYLEIVETAFK